MDKRLPLALLLSCLVLFVWTYYFAPKPPPPAPAPPAAASTPGAPNASGTSTPTAAPLVDERPALGTRRVDTEERTFVLSIGTPGKPGSYYARFTNKGAALLELRLGDSYDAPRLSEAERADVAHWTHLVDSVPQGAGRTASLALEANPSAKELARVSLREALWHAEVLGGAEHPTGIEFTLAPGGGLAFKKRITFSPGTYDIAVVLELANEAVDAPPALASFVFTPAEVVPQESGDAFYAEPQGVAAGRERGEVQAREKPDLDVKQRDDSGGTLAGSLKLPDGPLSFAGVHNKYFAMLMRGTDAVGVASMRGAAWRLVRDEPFAAANPDKAGKAWRYVATDVVLELPVPPRGTTRSCTYAVYAGPKDPRALKAAHADHEVLLDEDLGYFNGIANVLLWVLAFFERLTGNWGVAIILLTLLVRTLLFPLNRRSQTAMARYQKKMKRVQPLIEELKQRYAKDPQKLRQEQAVLMQKEGAFPPLGGCLPMFVQLPVFFGLFSALRASYDLRHAPFFMWVHDLSKPDQFMRIDLHLPLVGAVPYLNLLPILMVVLWVLQQKMMPKPTDEQALRMQKMMLFMPVVMGFFLYEYAAGLSLYMITQSGLGIVEQVVIKHYWPLDDTEQPPKKKSGWMAKIADLQAQQLKKVQAQEAARKREKARKR